MMRFLALCLGAVMLAAGSCPASAGATPADSSRTIVVRRSLDRHEAVLLPGDRDRPLPHAFIVPGSVSVASGDSLLVRGLDYDIDYDRGALRLRADHAADTLRVVYRAVPLSLAPRLALRAPAAPAGAPPGAPPARIDPRDAAGGPRLSLLGSKTFAIEVGNQRDLAVRQSLDLTVRGSVARDVEVLAMLSDRDTPLQPEGNTTELEELDRVLIDVNGRGLGASLGDLSLTFGQTEFARVDRKLEGVSARGERDGWSAMAAGARSRGEFRSVEFRGVEGKQGPYLLTGPSAERIVVLAGTERVWLDGAALTRGDKADYVIDYSLGEVTFTSRRSITATSRITVDFEYTLDAYRRSFYAATAGGSAAGGALAVRTTYLAEGDDRTAPQGVSLSEADRALLAQAGDDVETAGGAVYVGEGGDYQRIEESPASGETIVYYVYVGEGQGDYHVRFRRAPAGQGAYEDSLLAGGPTIYTYVGAGQGEFEPGADLVAPRSQDIADVMFEYRPGSALLFGAEGAVSREDLNTFSGRDDGDNAGRAFHIRGEVASPALEVGGRGVGRLRARASVRDVDDRFRSLGRVESGFSHETWNAAADGFGSDRRYEGGLEYLPSDRLRVFAEGGRLDARDDFSSVRRAFGIQSTGRVRFSLRTDRSDADRDGLSGRRVASRADGSVTIGRLTPSVRWRSERATAAGDTTGSGTAFDEAAAALSARVAAPLVLSAGVEGRRDDAREAGRWARTGDALAQTYGLELSGWRSLQARALMTHRRYDGRGETPSSVSDLGQLTLLHDAGSGGIVHEANVELTTTDLARRTRDVVFVGEGLGHYDEFGRFVGGEGDYEIQLGEISGSTLTSRVDATFRSDVRPERFLTGHAGSPAWLLRVRSGTQVRLSETSERSLSGMLRDPGRFDGGTVTGRLYWRQEFEISPWGSTLLLARHEAEDRRDRQYTNISSERSRREESLRARGAIAGPLTAEVEQRWRTEEEMTRLDASGAALSDRSLLRALQTTATLIGTPWPSLRAQVSGSVTVERLDGASGRNRVWDGGPSIAYAFASRGRIEARARWTAVDGGLDVRRFLPVSAGTGREGMEWSTFVDYRLGARVSGQVSADGRRYESGRLVTNGRLELRATF